MQSPVLQFIKRLSDKTESPCFVDRLSPQELQQFIEINLEQLQRLAFAGRRRECVACCQSLFNRIKSGNIKGNFSTSLAELVSVYIWADPKAKEQAQGFFKEDVLKNLLEAGSRYQPLRQEDGFLRRVMSSVLSYFSYSDE